MERSQKIYSDVCLTNIDLSDTSVVSLTFHCLYLFLFYSISRLEEQVLIQHVCTCCSAVRSRDFSVHGYVYVCLH